MAVPPSVKSILPSLQIKITEQTATLSMADLKRLFPSLDLISDERKKIDDEVIKMSLSDLRKVLTATLSGVTVDETWYLSQVPELRQSLQRGKFSSVAEHYCLHGYLEGRLPERPTVDERFYLQSYPDVAAAIKSGQVKSAFDHFVRDGYAEGRVPAPSK